MAEAVWAKCWASSPRDVCSTLETHRCKYGRHPARSSHAASQTEPVLSWLWSLHQKAALPAVSSVPLRHRAGAARLVFGLSGSLSFSRILPSCAQYVIPWEGAEARLRAAHERVHQRANEGHILPRSFGCARAGARLPRSRSEPTPEPAFLLR